jgi:flagellar biogenesis protein FliO
MGNVELVGRVLVSLVVVLAVVWVLGRKFRRGGKGKAGNLIDVLSRQQLSRTASLAVVRVGSQALIVGITEGQVNVLGETDLVAALAETSVPTPSGTTAATAATHRVGTRRSGHNIAVPTREPAQASPGQALPAQASPAASRRNGDANRRGPLAGSALSPATWRQTIESLRDLSAH